ncbi:CotH kinase family protein [Membranihabitans marinus]|uniref:CotH kinase family protein n=1 Tax=Membranihabitans marinus TaxID=1227546 RepID=UPI001F438439|nr:CotH kinase family protein [Membranihabitans marinus]
MKNKIIIIISALLMAGSFGCKEEIFVEEGEVAGGLASHNNGYPADYDVVFDDSKVNKIVIKFSADDWSDMQQDLVDKISGSGGGRPGGVQTFSNEDPSYFPANIYFNDLVWENVGVRYKGNSSLRANSGKLPLRFDFDEFEDDYEGIYNQRFYGFKELSLSSNYNDASLIREKSADELFRSFGVPAVRTAFYEVYIDKGNGEEYYGVYTMCEVVFDTFLEDYFGSNTGNCYKPEDDGASFAQAGFTLDGFELKTNEDIGDKSDITEMYNYLHASNRTTDAAQWRADLESVFDVDGFLRYLAVNNTIQIWDTYGNMPHNYYLYHDPADDLIKWIVWDNNEAFQNGNSSGSLSFAMNEVGSNWPLINYIANDEVYFNTYKTYVKSFIESYFSTSIMDGIYSSKEDLLQESADAERSGYSYVNGRFNSAISTLKSHNASRVAAANSFLQ